MSDENPNLLLVHSFCSLPTGILNFLEHEPKEEISERPFSSTDNVLQVFQRILSKLQHVPEGSRYSNHLTTVDGSLQRVKTINKVNTNTKPNYTQTQIQNQNENQNLYQNRRNKQTPQQKLKPESQAHLTLSEFAKFYPFNVFSPSVSIQDTNQNFSEPFSKPRESSMFCSRKSPNLNQSQNIYQNTYSWSPRRAFPKNTKKQNRDQKNHYFSSSLFIPRSRSKLQIATTSGKKANTTKIKSTVWQPKKQIQSTSTFDAQQPVKEFAKEKTLPESHQMQEKDKNLFEHQSESATTMTTIDEIAALSVHKVKELTKQLSKKKIPKIPESFNQPVSACNLFSQIKNWKLGQQKRKTGKQQQSVQHKQNKFKKRKMVENNKRK